MFKIGSRFARSAFNLPNVRPAQPQQTGTLVAVLMPSGSTWEIARFISGCGATRCIVVTRADGFVYTEDAWVPLTADYSPMIPEVGEVIRVSPDDSTLEDAGERKFIRISDDGAGVVCEHVIPYGGEFTWEYWERIPPAVDDAADKDSVAFAGALASGNIDELIKFLNSAFASEASFESAERELESAFSEADIARLNAAEDALFHALLSGSGDDGEDDLSTFEGAVAALNREGRIERVEFSDNDNTYSCSKETWNESCIAAAKSSLETKRARNAALAKLTAAERTLLGLDD